MREIELVTVIVIRDIVVEDFHDVVEEGIVDTNEEGGEITGDSHLVFEGFIFVFVVDWVLDEVDGEVDVEWVGHLFLFSFDGGVFDGD